MNRRGWHDEWEVTGRPDPDLGPVAERFDSRSGQTPGHLAEVAARALMHRELDGPEWLEGPTLRRRRIFTGEWEDVDVRPRPGPTRAAVRRARQPQGARP